MSTAMRAAEIVYLLLLDDLDKVRSEILELRSRNTATIAYGYESRAFAELPTGLMYNQVYWVSDARKAGETAGNGTGVPAIYDVSSSTWLSLFTGSAISV